MSLTLPTFVLSCAVCYGLFRLMTWHFKRRHLYESFSKLQGPPTLPIVGNGHMLFGNGEYILNKLTELSRSYPSPFKLWIGSRPFVIVTDADQIKEVCFNPKTLEKGDLLRDLAGPLIGEGLVTGPISKWRAHRKVIEPTFNKKILDSFVQIFVAQSLILTEQMEQNLDGPEFEIFQLLSSCSLDMICESAMGVQIGAQTTKNCHYGMAIQQVMDGFSKRFFSPWLHTDFVFYKTKVGRDQRKNIEYLHGFAENIINMKETELLKRNSRQSATTDNKPSAASNSRSVRETFLDQLMKLTDDTGKLSDKELREEVDTMILAGNETTATTMSFMMLMLASHTDVQDKVYQELYEIYGDADSDDRPVMPSDFMHMKYLECVIKETLRLFTPIPFIIREVTEDFTLDGYTLPKGINILVGIYSLQRQEKYWPDPLKFNPERFSPEANGKRPPYSFLAFGGGPRTCIGQNYSMMSMKTVMATILRRYVLKKDHIVPPKNIRLSLESVMKPVEPITLRIERRIKLN